MLRHIRRHSFPQHLRYKHSSAALEKIRERLENGPNFQDFIQNPTQSSDKTTQEFDGKLKKEKGDKERLRLPPWLKTTIPIGELGNCATRIHIDVTARFRKKLRQN